MKFWLALTSALLLPLKAMANPACVVCTFAIGASLEIARQLGISDNIVGLWTGAMLSILGYWTIFWFDKKNWHFIGRDFLLMSLNIAMVGFIYIDSLVYEPRPYFFLYLDPFLMFAIIGALIFIISQNLYLYMKKRNGGHAHFPFEKVVLPVILLVVTSILMKHYSI